MTGCNREGGKGRNEGSPPRPSVPPKLASLASFPEPPPQRTAVLPSKTRFTTKTGVLCFLTRNPPPPPPPKGQLFCPPRPSLRQNWRPLLPLYDQNWRPLLPFHNPPPPKDSCFALQSPLYDQNWRPLLPFQNPPAVLPSKALCTTKTGVLCFLSRTPPPTQRTAVLPSKGLCTTKTGVLCFLLS